MGVVLGLGCCKDGDTLGWGHRGDGTQRDPRGGDTVMDVMGMDTMKMGTQRDSWDTGDNLGMGTLWGWDTKGSWGWGNNGEIMGKGTLGWGSHHGNGDIVGMGTV